MILFLIIILLRRVFPLFYYFVRFQVTQQTLLFLQPITCLHLNQSTASSSPTTKAYCTSPLCSSSRLLAPQQCSSTFSLWPLSEHLTSCCCSSSHPSWSLPTRSSRCSSPPPAAGPPAVFSSGVSEPHNTTLTSQWCQHSGCAGTTCDAFHMRRRD